MLLFAGSSDVRLDREHALLARLHQNVVEQLEEIDVFLAVVARTTQQREDARTRGLDDLGGIADDERTCGGATDDHELGRMPQQDQMPTAEREAEEHAHEHDDAADDQEHAGSPGLGAMPQTSPLSARTALA